MQRVVLRVCLVVMLAWVGDVSAVWFTDADPADSNWNTPGNWDSGVVPTQAAVVDAAIDAGTVYIDGVQNPAGSAANSQWLTIGFSGGAGPAVMDISGGGQLGTGPWGPGEMFVAGNPNGQTAAVGVVNIDGAGSAAKSEGWRIASGPNGGIGTVNITNGGAMISGHWGTRIASGPPTQGTGTVNIIDGTMHIWGLSTSETLTMGAGGLIDIRGTSMLTLDSDQTALINGFVASGNIVGNGVAGNVIVQFNLDTGFTEAFVPEPVTLALLGVGGLFLRRRRA